MRFFLLYGVLMKELLQLSRDFDSFCRGVLPKAQNFHLYRLRHFVDSSSKGEKCTYAIRTAQQYEQENEMEEVREFLNSLRDTIDDLLERL